MRTVLKAKWFQPLFALALGGACLAAFWLGGNPRDGVYSLLVLAAVACLLLVGGRSDTIRGLRGDGRDERWERIDIHATALAGLVLLSCVIGMCFWEWAHGRSGSPYTQLAAISGIAYLVAIGFMRWRG